MWHVACGCRSFLSWKEVRKKAKDSEKLNDESAVLESDVGMAWLGLACY
jgi:hypothetical protein